MSRLADEEGGGRGGGTPTDVEQDGSGKRGGRVSKKVRSVTKWGRGRSGISTTQQYDFINYATLLLPNFDRGELRDSLIELKFAVPMLMLMRSKPLVDNEIEKKAICCANANEVEKVDNEIEKKVPKHRKGNTKEIQISEKHCIY